MLDQTREPEDGTRPIGPWGRPVAYRLAAKALDYYERGLTNGRTLGLVLADDLPSDITHADALDAAANVDAVAADRGIDLSAEQREAVSLAFDSVYGVVGLAQRRGNAPRDNLADWARLDVRRCRKALARSSRGTPAAPARTNTRVRGAGRPRRRVGATSRTSSADPGDSEPASPASSVGRLSALRAVRARVVASVVKQEVPR